jgi:hypothetical protein
MIAVCPNCGAELELQYAAGDGRCDCGAWLRFAPALGAQTAPGEYEVGVKATETEGPHLAHAVPCPCCGQDETWR